MSAVAERVLSSQGVVIAVDPHKASWTAVAVTAGLAAAGAVRVEANRAGYRQLNYALHVMALAQIRYDGPGRSYYQRKRAAGKATKKRCAASNAASPTSSTAP